jgi:N-acetylglutamate synthase-like GNAT family acetyltransferase
MVEYALRSATAADLPAIKQMIRYARLNPLGINWKRFTLAVNSSGEIIGCGQIKLHRDGSQELASLVVRRRCRRQGVARSIVRRLMQAQDRPFWLTCASSLIPFYERLGFREVKELGQMPAYFHFVKRLFPLVAPLFRGPDYLAVMRYHADDITNESRHDGPTTPL